MIEWNTPKYSEREKELVGEVIDSGYVSEGPKTKELEKKLAELVGCKYIVMTTSATAALYLAIEADKRVRGYVKGEVIIPALTFIGTKNPVELARLDIIYSDVNPGDFTLDDRFVYSKKTKIVIPVNLLGRGCSEEIINNKDYTTICDNAGCLGSDVPIGKVGCYSLQANKVVNCGQGGFCATNDERYYKEIRKIKDFGREDKEDNRTIGFNFKFNDILAAVVLGQLETIEDRRIKSKEQLNKYYKELNEYGEFMDYLNIEIPLWIEFMTDKRDELHNYLLSKGIKCRKPWKPLMDLENSIIYYNQCLWLPNGFGLTEKEQEEVIKSIKEFYGKNN